MPFYLMEVLSGMSLREALARTPKLKPLSATGIAIGIVKALVFAHDKKVVHCDLKPDNIFIVQREAGMLVKLLDFGAMKAMLVSMGYAGAAGTVNYMSPEQLRGQEVDARTDLFSCGVTLYEMLAGKHPFADFTSLYSMRGLSFTLRDDTEGPGRSATRTWSVCCAAGKCPLQRDGADSEGPGVLGPVLAAPLSSLAAASPRLK